MDTSIATTSMIALVQAVSSVVSPAVGTVEDIFNPSDYFIPAHEQCLTISGPSLQIGSRGTEVLNLQKVLNIAPDTRVASSGPGSPGYETDFFGPLTRAAVSLFQQKYRSEVLIPAGVDSATGFFGHYTRTKAAQICNLIVSANITQNSFMSYAKKTYTNAFNNKTKTKKTAPVSQPIQSTVVSETDTTPEVVSTLSQKINGECSTTINTCTVGTFADVRDTSSNNKWSCRGLSGGTTDSCSLSKQTTEPTVTTPQSPTTVSSGSSLEWGAFSGYSSSDLSSFEKLVGAEVDMKAVFTNWDDEFPIYAVTGLKTSDKTLVIFWEQYGVTLDSIIAGNHDAYIKSFASDAKSYGGKVILSPFHEMNGDWDPWGGTVGTNTPDKVVAAWKHIHDVFGTVSNVKFAWAVNNISVPNTAANAISKYYPGDAYVDYVAVDGFNFGNPWQSFDTIFGDTLKQVSSYKKPMYILSVGSAEGSLKSAWIQDAFGVQIHKYPLVKGWVWFNENKERDWRVNSDSASLDAFKSVLP